MQESIIFYFFSFFAILSTIIMISIKDNFYSVIFLITTFACVVMLFYLLNAEYLALTIAFIKIVSLTILFMFLFMSTKPNKEIHTLNNFKKSLFIILLISIFIQLIFSYTKNNKFLENLSKSDNLDNSNIINLIGKILYTDYILLVHISGGILCISMIGVAIIVNRYMHDVKLRNKVNIKSKDELIINNINSSKNMSIK